MKQKLVSWVMITIGCLIFGFAVNYFILANHLAEGGFTGLGLLLYYRFGLPVGAFFLLSNLPLLLIGWRLWGRDFLVKTLFGVVVSAIAVELFAPFALPVDNLLLPALYGGLLNGLGLGLVLRYGGTTGGADILGRMANQFLGWSLGRFYLFFDIAVLALVALLHGLTIALYSMVTVFLSSRVVDFVVDGLDSAKQAIIVSNHHQAIADYITKELSRGCTLLDGHGGYDPSPRTVILCVVSRWEIFRLRKAIHELDPNAFLIISNVFETYGQGFKQMRQKKG